VNPLWQFDLDAFRAIHVGLHRDWLDPVFWVITSTGLGWVQAAVILLFPLVVDLRHRLQAEPRLWRAIVACWIDERYALRPLIGTLAISGLFFAQGIKRLIAGRERPSLLAEALPQETISFNSFPSGHTTTSFALATMLVLLTWKSDRAWIGRYAMVWAALVGLSRVYRGVHWPTDVLAGALIGVAAACAIYLLCMKWGWIPVREPTDLEEAAM
jgi:membrane-associated phospholipid phosphatase